MTRFSPFLILTLIICSVGAFVNPAQRSHGASSSLGKHEMTDNSRENLWVQKLSPLKASMMRKEKDNKVESSPISSNQIVGMVALVLYPAVCLAAYNLSVNGINDLPNTIFRDTGASILSTILASIWVKIWTNAKKDGIIPSILSRKIIHTTSAPLFLFVWPLFSSSNFAQYFASIVPILNAVKLYLAGSNQGDKDLADAVSRSGDSKEALEGPLFYTFVLIVATLLWRDSLPGVVAVSTMAAGDGMADIVGRKFGKNNKWPFSKSKSIAGSTAFFASSLLVSFGLTTWLSFTGSGITGNIASGDLIWKLAIVCFVSTIVELLPIGDDNWTVPAAAAIGILILN